jgi:hypothetical protein
VTDTGLPISGLLQRSPALAGAINALAPAQNLIDRVFYDDITTSIEGDSVSVWLSLIFDGQVGFDLPGGFAIKMGRGDGVTPLTFGLRASPAGVRIAVEELAVVLAIPPSLLRPPPPADGGTPPANVELILAGEVIFDESRNLRVEGFDSVSLPRSFVGSTSIVVSATDVSIDTARGLILREAIIELPKDLPQLAPEELVLDNAVIGPAGVSGKLTAVYTPQFDAPNKQFTGNGSGELAGVPFAFSSIAIELRDNSLVSGSLAGQLLLPFFDHPVGVTIALHADGSILVDLAGDSPLATIERSGLLRLAVEHIGFEVANGKLTVHTGGTVTLLVGGTEWPTFRASDITIDTDGNISVHGAGLVLKNGKPLNLGPSPAGGLVPGITVDKLEVSGSPLDSGLVVDVELSTTGSIGPFTATLQHVGAHARLAVAPSGGGAVAGDLTLRPPSGIGLSVDAEGVISGGGLLLHDATQNIYGGAMKLSVGDELTVTAFGLIATRMPDGSPGYSVIIFVTAEDFRPIPLGMGFTLQGIGGMVAYNRTFDQDVLRAGMQNDTLKGLLFPRDPVTNAATIIRSLAAAFPAKSGSYLLGILARIGWFTPTLITLDLALIMEFGARRRLLVLGRVSALLPSPDNDLVRINLDSMGVIDFDQNTASIDATLVDSRLAKKFALTGMAALRAGWGSGPHQAFVLAVGGFNPHFAPPAGVPPLSRVAIALCSGNNPRLTCEAYFAITANTIQFGANAALYAEACSFSIAGDIGFDVLITRAPLHFIADYHASVQLKYGSHNLFKVAVEGSLEGPRPLRVSGKATFEIFWCDFSVRFDKKLIDGDPPPPPPAIDVLAELNRALATAQSWSTQAPAGRSHGVALRKLAPGTALVLDPLGRLAIKQDVVPLNSGRDIDVFGGAPVAGARRFALAAALNNVDLTQMTALQAPFAPAQFFAMSDDEKLTAPSFQQMEAGFVVGNDDAVTIDAAQLVAAPLEYDSIIIDTLAGDVPPKQPAPYVLPAAQLAVHAATGAAARAPVRRVGRARFRTPGQPAVELAAPAWAIAPLDGGPPVAVAATVKTWSEYQGALTNLNRAGASFQLVPAAALAA